MSDILPAFWAGAALLSGRIDLLSFVARPEELDAFAARSLTELCTLGVPPALAWTLVSTPANPSPGPTCRLGQSGYPSGLALLPYAPPVLFLRGDLRLLHRPALAVVGARRCSEQGRRFAAQVTRAVVEAGGVVVSGLAWGIDEAAHEAALQGTIAVLAQGFDTLSGRSEALAARIVAAGGLLVSEFPPHRGAARHTFPQRNRVIAGLSRATAVIEATEHSGSLITARLAAEYGREVLAVPGHPSSPMAQGCLDLIGQGAGLLRAPADALDAIELRAAPKAPPRDPLLAALYDSPDFDTLIDRTGEPPPLLLRRLAELELQGAVLRLPGDRYAESA